MVRDGSCQQLLQSLVYCTSVRCTVDQISTNGGSSLAVSQRDAARTPFVAATAAAASQMDIVF